MNDGPTLGERYSRATRSSDLEVTIDPGDVDYLIAAGKVKETLATRLIRLRGHFDQTRRGGAATTVAREGIPRYLIPALKGFQDARTGVVEHALSDAPQRLMLDEPAATDIAERVLDLFLDPNCPACDGRRFTGVYGTPTIRCTVCRETGRRSMFCRTEKEELFARWLQSSIEGKVEYALGVIGKLVRILRQRSH